MRWQQGKLFPEFTDMAYEEAVCSVVAHVHREKNKGRRLDSNPRRQVSMYVYS